MPVPNTTTFTLQDVVDEVNPTTDTLDECFTAASAALFDALYEGSKDRLYNFRNYGALTGVTMLSKGATTAANACAATGTITRYITGGDGLPNTGEIVYQDSGGVTVYAGADRYYTVGSTVFQISNSGVISNVNECAVTTTTTTTCATLTSYTSTGAESSSTNACNASNTFTRYHDGSGSSPVNGDIVYSDACGTSVFAGLNNWYSDSVGFGAYQIDNSGVVSNFTIC